jgi:tricorn protease
MIRSFRFAAALTALILAASLHAVDIHDTRLLTQPAVSADRIAFAYANDLWVANVDGSGVRRLTSHPGIEGNPRFSPDGKWIAFSGEYDGNTDVYIVASEGVPQRLTWHPGEDLPQGFTPDGAAVVFTSPREVHTMRYRQLFAVPAGGGAVSKLPIPNASEATFAPDGAHIVYQPLSEAFTQWKHYRGGTASRLLVFDTKTYAVEQIPQPQSRANDTDPMWVGEKIYFLSDRNGEFNLHSYDPQSKQVAQLTRFTDFPIIGATAGAGKIIFEQAGYSTLRSRDRAGESREGRRRRGPPRYASALREGREYIRGASLCPPARASPSTSAERSSPSPREGDDRNLTRSLARTIASFVVTGRQIDRVVLRRVGRIPALPPVAGRQRHAAQDQPRRRGLLRGPEVVARFDEDRVHRQLTLAVRP